MKNWFLVTFFFLTVSSVFAQGKITGIVYDENGLLPGANIVIEGTTVGVATDFDGTFSLNSASASGKVVISFLGFTTKKIDFSVGNGKTTDLGTIVLSSDENVLGEIVIKSTVVDIAKDRKTPVAVSTIKGSEIKEKLGSQEFPEVLANTPSVYATKSGGGFGDSRINIRGFSQENIAVMINGVPVNDMENSRVFWSNWAGLSDVTSAMQVQRGLGSSKLAISSVGGTINIVTRTADIKQGGSVSAMLGNDDYFKTLASYSTGKMKNGLSASVLFSNTQGNGYVNGTKFSGQNYFVGVGYEINDKHDVQLTFTGAPQWHNQRSAAPTIATYIKYGQGGEPNIRYNSDWGYLNGKEYSFRTNYYHKPVASFNYDWKINDGTKISTVLYGSWGRGGGSNGTGGIRGNRYFDPNLRTPNGTVNVDLIQAWNSGQQVNILGVPRTRELSGGFYQNSTDTGSNRVGSATVINNTSGISKISSINSHNWYGGVINLNKKLTDKLTLDFGLDARTYRGIHFQNVNDLLGATNYSDNTNVNNIDPVTGLQTPRVLYGQYAAEPNGNPFFNSDYQEKINYNNDGLVRWYGAFTQLEYTTEKLTAFIQGAVSQQGFKRVDYFKYLSFDPLSSTKYERILAGNVKGGANYNINDKHNVFVNAGYYSKQPFFNAVYPVNTSKLNEDLTNEKILGIEVGYGFRSAVFNANLNLYRTTWDDRFLNSSTANVDPDDNPATNNSVRSYAFMSGVNQIHQGVELDFTVKPFSKLTLNGMFSYGDWNYGDSVVKSSYFREDNNLPLLVPVTPAQQDPLLQKKTEQNISGLKVGDAAQMTASLGATYEVVERLKLDANYRYTDRLFASFEPSRFTTQTLVDKGSLELPAYGLMDAGVSYKILVGKDKSNSVNLRLNVNNVLDEIYIAESRTNVTLKNQTDFITAGSYNVPAYQAYQATGTYDGVDKANEVFFGFGRTWNFSISYNF